ncbi:amidase (plasmid) [Rhodococcoides fascians]|uniref:amidase n=1 Tax=Rhodococcoides fascians TaxID=1828 RepID=UPI00389AC363
MKMINSYIDDALGSMDAVGVAEAIAARRVSRAEVRAAAIARCVRVDNDLNAIAIYEDGVRDFDTFASLPAGFFHGVPTFVKDMVQIAGFPTGQGTDAWVPKTADRDGAYVERFRKLGVDILGISRMSEFGFLPVAEHPRLGPVRNPWNTDLSAGGSSSGAAALVASGAVPFAHAVDGGGSIRIPASCTGLVGLKPSRGRLPLDTELRRIPIRIAYNGMLTRTVRDTAAFFREMEQLYRTPRLPPVGDITGPSQTRLKIAVATKSPAGTAVPEVHDETLRVAALLESLGHRVEKIDTAPVPKSLVTDFVTYWELAAWSTLRQGTSRFGPSFNRTLLDNFTLGLAERGSKKLAKVPGTLARLSLAAHASKRFYANFDVLLTPTLAAPPPLIGELSPTTTDFDSLFAKVIAWNSFAPLQNVSGDPSMSLPTGRSLSGSPIGISISAGRGHEARLLHLAFELERTQDWNQIAARI